MGVDKGVQVVNVEIRGWICKIGFDLYEPAGWGFDKPGVPSDLVDIKTLALHLPEILPVDRP